MRSFLTYGLISLVGVAALYACGDDSGDGSTSTGGTPGVGGSAGSGVGGTAGVGMSGAGGSGGATGGSAGAGNVPTAPAANCQGCVQLTVGIPATPISATNGSQGGYIFSSPATAAPFDLTNVTTITWRVQALTTGAAFFVQPFLQNAPPEDPAYAFGSYPAQVILTPAAFAANAWVDVVLNVAALAGGAGGADAGVDGGAAVDAGGDAGAVTTLTAFDKSKTRTIGLNVGALPTSPLAVVSVEVDSVTVAGTSNFTTKTFDTTVDGLSLNMYMVPTGTLPPSFH
jgi:hypothetical protein